MRNALVFVLVMVPWLVIGCDKDKPADTAPGQTPGQTAGKTEAVAAVSAVETDLPKIKAALASPTPADADDECASGMANIAAFENVDPHQALAAELRKLCTEELPLAKAKTAGE